jgi:hypothetical protein
MRHALKEEQNSPDIFLLVRGLVPRSPIIKISKPHANQNTALHLKLFKLFYYKKPVSLSVAAIFSLGLFAIEEADSLISRISEKSKCP